MRLGLAARADKMSDIPAAPLLSSPLCQTLPCGERLCRSELRDVLSFFEPSLQAPLLL